jgi:hypothetical protein
MLSRIGFYWPHRTPTRPQTTEETKLKKRPKRGTPENAVRPDFCKRMGFGKNVYYRLLCEGNLKVSA